MRRARRAAGHRGNLFKRQAAPEVGDDDLTLLDRQRLQLGGGLFGIDRVGALRRIGLEPGIGPDGGGRLVTSSVAARPCPRRWPRCGPPGKARRPGYRANRAGPRASGTPPARRLPACCTTASRRARARPRAGPEDVRASPDPCVCVPSATVGLPTVMTTASRSHPNFLGVGSENTRREPVHALFIPAFAGWPRSVRMIADSP